MLFHFIIIASVCNFLLYENLKMLPWLIYQVWNVSWQNICYQIYKYMCRSGFMTTKGELVRAILFPPPLDLAFYDDFLKSVRVFLALGLIGMAYSLYMWISLGVSFSWCNFYEIIVVLIAFACSFDKFIFILVYGKLWDPLALMR